MQSIMIFWNLQVVAIVNEWIFLGLLQEFHRSIALPLCFLRNAFYLLPIFRSRRKIDLSLSGLPRLRRDGCCSSHCVTVGVRRERRRLYFAAYVFAESIWHFACWA